jgi:hypothetical protein
MSMKKMRFSLGLVAYATTGTVVVAACSVFEDPGSLKNNSGVTGNETGGGGGTNPGSGGVGGSTDTGGASGRDAGMTTASGGVANGGAVGAGGSGGSAGSAGKPMNGGAGGSDTDASVPSGPTEAWWPHKTAAGCDTAGVPKDGDRVKSDPGATVAPLYFAINHFRLGAVDDAPDPKNAGLTILVPDPNAWQSIGFDLDGACTRSATCQVNEELVDERACANAETVPFDGNNCIDNSIGNLFNIAARSPSIGEWFGMSEQDWNCEVWRGGFSQIFKISNYNGQYNDDSVTVDLYTSIGLKTLPQWSCRKAIDQPLATDWQTHAAWPQKQHWIITQDSISLSADPLGNEVPDSRWQDPTAYVRGGWLVVHFPDGAWAWLDGERTPSPGFREIMHRSVRLVHDPQSDLWRMEDGTWQYVARPSEMLEGFAQIGFCENMCGTFNTVKDYLNTYLDTLSTDTSAPVETRCDALSLGMSFRGAQISADKTDVQPAAGFNTCPQPKHPAAPRQGCTCSSDGSTCTLGDGGK